MSNEDDVMASEAGGVTRRTVVRSAAWSVPIIAMASSVPFAAASSICNPDSRTGNGLATVIPIAYPQDSPEPHEGGTRYVLTAGDVYSWTYQVTLREPSLAGSGGDFGVYCGSWDTVELIGWECSDSRISMGSAPAGYETQYARGIALVDLPTGTVFTVTVRFRFAAPSQDWAMNAWWVGADQNGDCSAPAEPAYEANSDAGNIWDTSPDSAEFSEDPIVLYKVV